MDRKRTLEQYKLAGAWMRICKTVIVKTWPECWSVLSAKDCRMFGAAERRISILCSRAEDNMFLDFPHLTSEAFDIFYGSPEIDPRTDTDREQLQLMQKLIRGMFKDNWSEKPDDDNRTDGFASRR